MSDYLPPETVNYVRAQLLQPPTPLHVGDFVVDIRGAYGQIKTIRNQPITDRKGADSVEMFEVAWVEDGVRGKHRVGTRSWEHRADIFFVKDQFIGEDRTP